MVEPEPEQEAKAELKINLKKIGKRFLVSSMRSIVAMAILRFLGEGLTPVEVAEKAHFSEQRVHYWVVKLLDEKLIFEYCTGKPRVYELTAFGKKVLTTSERGWKEPVLMESYDLKFRLLQNNMRFNCSTCHDKNCSLPRVGGTNHCLRFWERIGNPKNWQKWGFKYCGIQVERNDGLFPTVVIRSGELSGFDPYELVAEAGTVIALARAKLHDLGLIVDDVGVPLHEPLFHTYTEEAALLNKQGVVYTQGGHIDDSPLRNPVEEGARVPHEERNFCQQVTYMGLPALVIDLSKRVDVLSSKKMDSALESQLAALEFKADSLKAQVDELTKDNLEKTGKLDRLVRTNESLVDSISKVLEKLPDLEKNEATLEKITGLLSKFFDVGSVEKQTVKSSGGKDYVS